MFYRPALNTKAKLLFALFLVGLMSLKASTPFASEHPSLVSKYSAEGNAVDSIDPTPTAALPPTSYGTGQAQAATYDLAADWSNTSNPNGVWSYNEGSNPLPLQNPWSPSDPNSPPGWAHAQWPNFGHVPVWGQVNAAPQFIGDTQTGDVVVHSSDSGRGENYGPANVTWTSPSAGRINISGSAWIDRLADRSNKWSLYLNGTLLSSGNMFAGGGYYRSTPFDFSTGSGGAAILTNIAVSAGDVVKLEIVKLSTYGSFTGVNLRIIFEPGSQTCAQPPSGLVGWWPGDGNANDIANGNHGMLQGAASFAPGMVGQAFSLDGISGYIKIPHHSSLAPTSAITIDAWIKPTAPISGVAPIVKKPGSGDDSGYALEFWDVPYTCLWIFVEGRGWEGCYKGLTPLDQWTHVAGVFANGCNTVYINGSPVRTYCPGGAIRPGIGELHIGHDPANPDRFFHGLIDEVEIFNRALSASEIQAIYNAGNAGKCKPDSTDLAITKAFTSANVLTGSTLTSTITITNNGPAMATNITMTDNLPASTTFLSCSATSGGICSGSGNNRTVTFASLAAGSSATITLEATVGCSVADGSVIVNTASVSSPLPDSDMSNNSMTATATALNPPPVITCPTNVSTAGNVLGSCSAAVNPGAATATDNCPGVAVVGVRSDGQPLSAQYPLGATTITWTATDSGGRSAFCQQTVTVTNPNPLVTITGPPSGAVYAVGAPVNFTGMFTDNPGGTHTANWMFDAINQVGAVNETTGVVSATYTFTTAGVYMVKLIVNDGCGGTGMADTVEGLTAMVVIYDPNGGFVTGGGWINSPAGAYPNNPSLTGKANFGFVSKYQQGATVPTGQTEFQFKVAGLNFHSTVYQWLVVAGARAQYKGVGKINGAGNYGFLLTAIDGQISGGGGVDRFRIKIWDKDNNDVIVYDNKLGSSDNSNDSTELGGGSIVIHK